MYDDILDPKYDFTFDNKQPTMEEFKVIFCSVCDLYKDCQFNAIEQCIKEYMEDDE